MCSIRSHYYLQTQGYVSCSYSYSYSVTNLQNGPEGPIKSEIMDGFWCSRCLNDRIDLPDKIGSFLSGTYTPMVVKNGTNKLFHYQ